MRVSVIIPAHNAAGTLADTLASLRAQTFVDWEAIVIGETFSQTPSPQLVKELRAPLYRASSLSM